MTLSIDLESTKLLKQRNTIKKVSWMLVAFVMNLQKSRTLQKDSKIRSKLIVQLQVLEQRFVDLNWWRWNTIKQDIITIIKAAFLINLVPLKYIKINQWLKKVINPAFSYKIYTRQWILFY